MKKNTRGFTLVELLAVIVVLIIIFMIAMPTVTKVLKNVRKGAFESTAYGLIKTVENFYFSDAIEGKGNYEEFNFVDGILQDGKKLDHTGKPPKNGIIIVDEEGNIGIAIHDGEFCARKDFSEKKVQLMEVSLSECTISAEIVFREIVDEILDKTKDEPDLNLCDINCLIDNDVPIDNIDSVEIIDIDADPITVVIIGKNEWADKIIIGTEDNLKVDNMYDVCTILPFHFDYESQNSVIKYDCGEGIEITKTIYFDDFNYYVSTAQNNSLNYSNNNREQRYECSAGTWSQIQHTSPYSGQLVWDSCERNLNGECSGFPSYIWIEDGDYVIKIWRSKNEPYNLSGDTIYVPESGIVELSRVSTPADVESGAACTGDNGTINIYEAPIYEGVRYLKSDLIDPIINVDLSGLSWTKLRYFDFGYTQHASETQINVYDNGNAQIAVYSAQTPYMSYYDKNDGQWKLTDVEFWSYGPPEILYAGNGVFLAKIVGMANIIASFDGITWHNSGYSAGAQNHISTGAYNVKHGSGVVSWWYYQTPVYYSFDSLEERTAWNLIGSDGVSVPIFKYLTSHKDYFIGVVGGDKSIARTDASNPINWVTTIPENPEDERYMFLRSINENLFVMAFTHENIGGDYTYFVKLAKLNDEGTEKTYTNIEWTGDLANNNITNPRNMIWMEEINRYVLFRNNRIDISKDGLYWESITQTGFDVVTNDTFDGTIYIPGDGFYVKASGYVYYAPYPNLIMK